MIFGTYQSKKKAAAFSATAFFIKGRF